MSESEQIINQRYRLIRPIGRGGMGAVYEGFDLRLQTTVALKQMLLVHRDAERAFDREAQLLARLRHPGLPAVIDSFTTAEGRYLVMDFVSGPDLAQQLQQRGYAYSPAEVLPWAEQLFDILSYLHSRQPAVLHRDIKPQNIKVVDGQRLVLLDFGLARPQPGGVTSTMGSMVAYSAHYAPPEQLHGEAHAPTVDIYGAAATLYTLLTGHLPADALQRVTQTAIANGRDPLVPPNDHSPLVSKAVAQVLQRGLALDPRKRWQQADEFRHALRKAAGNRPARSLPPLGRSAAVAVLSAVLLGAGGMGWWLFGTQPERRTNAVTIDPTVNPATATPLQLQVINVTELPTDVVGAPRVTSTSLSAAAGSPMPVVPTSTGLPVSGVATPTATRRSAATPTPTSRSAATPNSRSAATGAPAAPTVGPGAQVTAVTATDVGAANPAVPTATNLPAASGNSGPNVAQTQQAASQQTAQRQTQQAGQQAAAATAAALAAQQTSVAAAANQQTAAALAQQQTQVAVEAEQTQIAANATAQAATTLAQQTATAIAAAQTATAAAAQAATVAAQQTAAAAVQQTAAAGVAQTATALAEEGGN